MAKGNLLKKLALGAAVAATAGYVAGVLSAPAEGKKTRKRLKKSADLGMNEIEKQLKQLHGELGEIVNQAKDSTDAVSDKSKKKFSGAVDNAHAAKDKLKVVLTAIHEGEASDKDLRKAVQDARRTLDHLREFIKK